MRARFFTVNPKRSIEKNVEKFRPLYLRHAMNVIRKLVLHSHRNPTTYSSRRIRSIVDLAESAMSLPLLRNRQRCYRTRVS